MAKYNNQKAKVLFLLQMMCETGENHTISMQEIIDRLQDKGIRAERKSIYDDMEALRLFGMDIQYKRERPSGYYVANAGEMVNGGFSVRSAAAQVPDNGQQVEADRAQETSGDRTEDGGDEQAWMHTGNLPAASDSGKQMKLSCTPAGEEAAREFFGSNISVKDRDGVSVAVVPLRDDKVFFGWITAMGEDIQILKPRKVSQAYREYLKQLARRYKTDK